MLSVSEEPREEFIFNFKINIKDCTEQHCYIHDHTGTVDGLNLTLCANHFYWDSFTTLSQFNRRFETLLFLNEGSSPTVCG